VSGKKEAPKQTPTLQVRVFFAGELVAEAEVKGGLGSMKGSK
jgi:hypothetical protein